jgi:hypothetical protein
MAIRAMEKEKPKRKTKDVKYTTCHSDLCMTGTKTEQPGLKVTVRGKIQAESGNRPSRGRPLILPIQLGG